jgi:hypothetical protein
MLSKVMYTPAAAENLNSSDPNSILSSPIRFGSSGTDFKDVLGRYFGMGISQYSLR